MVWICRVTSMPATSMPRLTLSLYGGVWDAAWMRFRASVWYWLLVVLKLSAILNFPPLVPEPPEQATVVDMSVASRATARGKRADWIFISYLFMGGCHAGRACQSRRFQQVAGRFD